MKSQGKTIIVFTDFSEFYYYTRDMNSSQRTQIYDCLSRRQKAELERSCINGGWADVYTRDQLDQFLEEFLKLYKIDMIDARIKVLSGKSVFMAKEGWEYLLEFLKEYSDKHVRYIIGGLMAEVCSANEKVVLLLPKKIIEEKHPKNK